MPAQILHDTSEYPFAAHYLDINGQQLHYIDTGGEGEVILFIHGTPSWSFDFRNVIKSLSPQYRCIALDHIGFGLSDKPESFDYSPANHSASLGKLIAHLKLKQLTLVMHDFGGPIGMQWARNHADKIDRLIILNSWLWDCSADPSYKKLQKAIKSPLLPLLYKYLNFSVKYLLPMSFGKRKLPKELHEQYKLPFRRLNSRQGTIGFAKSLLNDQVWFQDIWDSISSLIYKPTLFIWGMKDQFVTEEYLNKFSERFKNSGILRLESCGHFPQEEESEAVSKRILSFLQEK